MVILQPTRHTKMFSDYYLGCSNTWSLHLQIRHCPELPQVKCIPPAKYYYAENVGPAAIRAGLSLRLVPTVISDKGHKSGSLVTAVRGNDCSCNYN